MTGFVGRLRLKDMFIVRGRNIYPQDVESLAERSVPCLRTNANAAFSTQREGTEAVVLVQEIERSDRRQDTAPIIAAIRKAVFMELDITLDDVVIVEPGSVPMTSSGKVRRSEARQRYLRGEYPALHGAAGTAIAAA